jgi:methylglutaconyl-CoA hydratase
VIEPAISRKIGKSGFSQLALNPTKWQTAKWANEQGLYQEYFEDISQMDEYLEQYLQNMVSYSDDALRQMKLLLWEGTESWPILLEERAQKSAELLMQSSTQRMINSYLTS